MSESEVFDEAMVFFSASVGMCDCSRNSPVEINSFVHQYVAVLKDMNLMAVIQKECLKRCKRSSSITTRLCPRRHKTSRPAEILMKARLKSLQTSRYFPAFIIVIVGVVDRNVL
jgi:hypothetical protein